MSIGGHSRGNLVPFACEAGVVFARFLTTECLFFPIACVTVAGCFQSDRLRPEDMYGSFKKKLVDAGLTVRSLLLGSACATLRLEQHMSVLA